MNLLAEPTALNRTITVKFLVFYAKLSPALMTVARSCHSVDVEIPQFATFAHVLCSSYVNSVNSCGTV
jgi:hypothetical protein